MKKFLLSVLFFTFFLTKVFSQIEEDNRPVMIGEWTQDALNELRNYELNQKFEKHNFRATTQRSDTINLLHFDIHLTVGNGLNQTIAGYSIVEFKSLMNNVSQLYLDLLKLNVDSVIQNGQPLTFNYSDSTILKINLQSAMMQNDSSAVTVYYHGHPFNDNSFGGVYFNGDFGFNVGMSLYENPHNMGRTWHPCYDNFVERSTYEFHITCDSQRMALCNGALLDTAHNSDGTITWHWKMNETLPTFIAGFAVSKFTPVHDTFNGINGPVPVLFGAISADTTAMKNSFANLETCFHYFEDHYGAYPWNKIGFNCLPFNSGAMEHAGSVVYPQFACDGSLYYEDLYAHEFGHHWWGDYVTPYDPSEIWLKEGWAVFSEFLFYEGVYGAASYKSHVADNHEIALHYDHVFDLGYCPLSPMPAYTIFGRTTYTKSADVVHTLRTYMVDSLFFGCLKSFVQSHAFQNYTSVELRDYLSNCSGISLDNFFNDWVFSAGFPHFSIDSFNVADQGNGWYTVTTYIRQRLDHAPHFYHHVPLELTFMNDEMQSSVYKVDVSGPCTVYQTAVPFNPVFAGLDLENKISDAITDEYHVIKNVATNNFPQGKMNMYVYTVNDSAFLRVEHNWIAPDPMKVQIPNLHLSQERYWRVDGILSDSFDAKASIQYNGSNVQPVTSYNGGYLDRALITNVEDSLVVMYRPSVSADWQIDTDVLFNYQGSHTDKKGLIWINHIKPGEYTLAIFQHNKVDSLITPVSDSCFTIINVKDFSPEEKISIYPNPSQNQFTIEGNLLNQSTLEIFSLLGEKIYSQNLPKGIMKTKINCGNFGTGIFLIRISDSEKNIIVRKQVIIQN